MNPDSLHYRANKRFVWGASTVLPGDRIVGTNVREDRKLRAMIRTGHVTLIEATSTGDAVVEGRRRDGLRGPRVLLGRFRDQAVAR